MRQFKTGFICLVLLSTLVSVQAGEWLVFDDSYSAIFEDVDFETLFIDHENNVWAGAVNKGLYYYNFQQRSWTVLTHDNSPLPNDWVSLIMGDSTGALWVGTSPCQACGQGGLVRIDGNDWTIYNQNNAPMALNHVTCGIIDRIGTMWVGTASGVLRFDGEVWMQYTTLNSILPSNKICSLAVDHDNGLWIGTLMDGVVYLKDSVWIPIQGVGFNIGDIHVDKNNIVWIGNKGWGLSKIEGDEITMITIGNSDIPGAYVWSLTSDPDGNLWVGFGNYRGLAKFDGSNWTRFYTGNSPIPSDVISGLEFDPLGNLWMSAYYGAIAAFQPGGVVQTDVEDLMDTHSPSVAQLSNYPNPFNSSTAITYQLEQNGRVILEVLDMKGRTASVLFRGDQSAGIYRVGWDGVDGDGWRVSSGIYLIRLIHPQGVIVRKCIIQK